MSNDSMEGELNINIINGDASESIAEIDSNTIDCIITSPPYYMLRDYEAQGQIGCEQTYGDYLENLMFVFAECHRVLKDTGTLFIVIGDKYSDGHHGMQSHNLMLLPSRLAIMMVDYGYYLRSDVIWRKPNAFPMGGRVVNKFAPSYEHVLFLTKSKSGYYFNYEDVMEPAKYCGFKNVAELKYDTKYSDNQIYRASVDESPFDIVSERKKYDIVGDYKRIRRDVWDISTGGFGGNHYASFPKELVRICMTAGCPTGGNVLDPFNGIGTTGAVAKELGNNYTGIEINKEYCDITLKQLSLI